MSNLTKYIVYRIDKSGGDKEHVVLPFTEDAWEVLKDHPRVTAATITQAATVGAARSQGAYAITTRLNADKAAKTKRIEEASRSTASIDFGLKARVNKPQAAEPMVLGVGAGAW